MGVVQGLNKARMLAIEAASVISGTIAGDNLILTRKDGTTINAGNVRGPAGPTGDTIGAAGGDLTGSYPNPTIAVSAVTHTKVAAANKDGLAATPSMRTLGAGAQQSAPGNHTHGNIPTPTLSGNSTTYTPAAAVTNGQPVGLADLVFVAPPSGVVLLVFSAYLLSKTSGQATTMTMEVATGATLRAGTVVYAANLSDDGIANYSPTYVRCWSTIQLTGLTPGDSYNAYPVVSCGAAGATWTIGKTKAFAQA